MKLLKRCATLVAACIAAAGCDECRKYSDFSCRQIERAEYSVWFYYPSGSEVNLGQADGLQACGATAHNFAASRNLGGADWSYVCCMRAKGSECYEKHR